MKEAVSKVFLIKIRRGGEGISLIHAMKAHRAHQPAVRQASRFVFQEAEARDDGWFL